MIGYDIFGNKADITFCSTLEGLYKKIFFPEIAEKILLLGNKPLILRDLILIWVWLWHGLVSKIENRKPKSTGKNFKTNMPAV